MAKIPKEQIKEVVESVNISDFIGLYVNLKRVGSYHVGLCPFHNEKTPSFNVNENRNRYHCFGCDASGDVIDFLINYEKIYFIDAVKKLADFSGINLTLSEGEGNKTSKRVIYYKINNLITEWFEENLRNEELANHATNYLEKRKISPESIHEWRIGYAPNNKNLFIEWQKKHAISNEDLMEVGLISKSKHDDGYYPRFRDRLMFPIFNDFGEIIAFSGRILNNNSKLAKYINSPETSIFQKNKTFFGLNKSKRHIHKSEFAIVCEGQIDLITLFESGFKNVVAPLGTAFTDNHAQLLKRHTNNVVLSFDTDTAGFKASKRTFSVLSSFEINVKAINLPVDLDPDGFIKKYGTEKFQNLLDEQKDFIEFYTEYLYSLPDSQDNRLQIIDQVANVIANIKDPISRDISISQIAGRLAIPYDLIYRSVNNYSNRNIRQDASKILVNSNEAKNENSV